jgi:hypothetical protein
MQSAPKLIQSLKTSVRAQKSGLLHKSVMLAAVATLLSSASACEAEKPAAETPKETAQAPKEQLAAASVAPKPEVAKEPEKAERPKTIDTTVSAERRELLEKAYPDAKGFLVAAEIEEKLKKDKSNTAKAPAIKSFDKTTKGKWVLFSGPLVNATETGFDLAVSYTPLAPNDPMGISRQFFTVTLSNIEGYKKSDLKVGTMVVVLAKYTGGAVAGPGYELVAADKWK